MIFAAINFVKKRGSDRAVDRCCASCAVARDIKGRDGALKPYYADEATELFLFKFCGQV